MAQKFLRGGSIYLRKDGRWEGRRRVGTKNGRGVYASVYARSYDEAAGKLDRLPAMRDGPRTSGRLRDGEPAGAGQRAEQSPVPVDARYPDGTAFGSVAEEWLHMRRPQLKPASLAIYANIVYAYLIPRFGSMAVPEITRADLSAFAGGLLDGSASGKTLSSSTVSMVLTVVKNIFRYAAQEKNLPVADIRGIPVRQQQKEPPMLSVDEQEKLTAWLCNNLTPCNLGILLCLSTGIRLGEVCALQWRNISPKDQSVAVCRSMQRVRQTETGGTEVRLLPPKSAASVRVVPVTRDMARLLEANRRSDDSWLLTGEADRYMEPRALQRQFKEVLRQCGLGDINFHALRHTFATRGIELGCDPKTMSSILGHSSVSITLNRYVHTTMEQKQRVMDLFPAFPLCHAAEQDKGKQ